MRHLSESGEMYLEAIYTLSQKNKEVHSVSVSEFMGYSKPSVSRAVSLLKKDGLLLMDSEGHLKLTKEGLQIAKGVCERHALLTRLLIGLGVSEGVAAADACKMEHVLSDETFAAIKRHAAVYVDAQAKKG